MREFSKYVRELRLLAVSAQLSGLSHQNGRVSIEAAIDGALDGGAGRALRRLVDVERLRKHGAFFTGSTLSKRAARLLAESLDSKSVILDPACGAGDLLLACAELLPKAKLRASRLARWETQLHGRDLAPTFVEAARLRLALLSGRNGLLPEDIDGSNRFPGVQSGCGMSDSAAIRGATHIVLNPPFTLRTAPSRCTWGSGLVNSAAVFVDGILRSATPGTRIVAILPDVLRSGDRYSKWRQGIRRQCHLLHVGLGDQFDPKTDINVFLLSLKVRRTRSDRKVRGTAWKAPKRNAHTVADVFDVSVGPVVDYRDPHEGQWHKFVRSQTLEPWSRLSELSTHRRFDGRLIKGPFIAVKRTSRPDDAQRAVASLVTLKQPAAVENHVLVLQPKDGSIRTCKKLMTLLARPSTSKHLNQRIRCRHLTVSALRELPWGDK